MTKITITSKIEAEELRKALAEYDSKPVRWRPMKRSTYFFQDECGIILRAEWCDSKVDHLKWNSFNCFPTREMAESCLPDLLRAKAYIMAARTVDPDFVPDWDDAKQEKWACYYNCANNEHSTYSTRHCDDTITYVSTEKKALEMIELLKSWGVK